MCIGKKFYLLLYMFGLMFEYTKCIAFTNIIELMFYIFAINI